MRLSPRLLFLARKLGWFGQPSLLTMKCRSLIVCWLVVALAAPALAQSERAGWDDFYNKKYVDAGKKFEALLKVQPQNAAALFGLAKVRYEQALQLKKQQQYQQKYVNYTPYFDYLKQAYDAALKAAAAYQALPQDQKDQVRKTATVSEDAIVANLARDAQAEAFALLTNAPYRKTYQLLFESKIYDRYTEADTLMSLREALVEQCARYLDDYPTSPNLREVKEYARDLLAEYTNLANLRQYGERSGRMYEKFCNLVTQHFSDEELKNLVPQFYGAEFGFGPANYADHPNFLALQKLAAKHQTSVTGLLCQLNLHHQGFAKEKAALYDDFIRAFAPQDMARVALLKMAQPLLAERKWAEAAALYRQYQPVFRGQEDYFQRMNLLLTDANDRRELKNLGPGVNSAQRDYNPVLSLDGRTLYFSRRNANTGEDIFRSFWDQGAWLPAQPLDKKVNTPSHEVPLGVSPDGNTLFLFGNYAALPEFYYVVSNEKRLGKGDLYYAERQGASWSRLYVFPYPVNTPHFEAGLNMTASGQAVLFSSDRPGGVGGHFPNYHPDFLYYHGAGEFNTDLYVSEKTDKGWGEPINLGQVVNTPYAEINPWLHPDMRTLYFCSDGHYGLGGYDIFMCKRLREDSWTEWSAPVNLGKTINSPGNDSFYMTADGQTALVTSTQAGNSFGSSDIYSITVPVAYRPEPVVVIAGQLQGPDGKGIGAKIRWQERGPGPATSEDGGPPTDQPTVGQPKTGQSTGGQPTPGGKPARPRTGVPEAAKGEVYADPITGKFTIALKKGKKYVYYADHPDYFGSSVEVDLTSDAPPGATTGQPATNPQPSPADQPGVRLGPIQPGLAIGQGQKMFTLPTLNFDHNSDNIRPESFFDLDRLAAALAKYPKARLSIEGHTDDVGKDDLNLDLSQRRAEAVRRYLVDRGCPASIAAKGFGETRPLSPNTTEAGRQANRRVEFRVE